MESGGKGWEGGPIIIVGVEVLQCSRRVYGSRPLGLKCDPLNAAKCLQVSMTALSGYIATCQSMGDLGQVGMARRGGLRVGLVEFDQGTKAKRGV